jgi:hypothetical protein
VPGARRDGGRRPGGAGRYAGPGEPRTVRLNDQGANGPARTYGGQLAEAPGARLFPAPPSRATEVPSWPAGLTERASN